MDEDEASYQAVGEVLGGLRILPLPEGWTPVDTVSMVKCLDEDGQVMWSVRSTPGMSMEEVLGALISRTDLLRKAILADYEPEDD